MRRAALALCLIALAGCGGDDGEPVLPQGRALDAEGTITPRTSLFGDTLTARLEAVVDRRRIDPGSLVLKATFAPFERIGPVAITRRDIGHETHLSYVMRLRCDEFPCLPQPAGSRNSYRFPPARLGAAFVRWGPVEVSSRINESDPQPFRYRATLSPLPEPSYRIGPGVVAAAAFTGAALLLLLAGLIAARAARRAWARRRPELDLPPLERALLLVRLTSERGDAEGCRKALELLAETLPQDGLAERARELAWSAPGPARAEVESLLEEVRAAP